MRSASFALLVLPSVLAGCGTQSHPADQSPAALSSERPADRSDAATSTPAPPTSTAVDAFLRFAVGDGAGRAVPWGAEVISSIEGTPVGRLDATTASTPPAWDDCAPRATTVEGRTCPVNVLRAISDRDRSASPVVIESSPPGPVLGCAHYRTPRPRATELWLRPPQDQRDCFSDMAVAVTLSAADEIVAVDLALSGP